jgi:hypothetical protein
LLASRPAREGTSGRKEFLVKWAGYDSPSDRTWEPRSNLGSAATARKLVKDLQQRQEATRSTPPPPPDQTAKRRKPPGAGRPRRRPCGATAKKADVATVAAAGGGKSAYEVAREQKIAANEAMLRQLGLIGASSPTVSLRHAAAAGARSNQPSSSRRPRAARQPRSPTELRRSARSHAASAAQRGAAAAAATGEDSCGSVPRAGVGGQRRIVLAPVDAAALDAAGRTASAVEGATFTKVMTRSMVEYSYKFGIGSAGAAVLPTYGSSPGGSRKMIVRVVLLSLPPCSRWMGRRPGSALIDVLHPGPRLLAGLDGRRHRELRRGGAGRRGYVLAVRLPRPLQEFRRRLDGLCQGSLAAHLRSVPRALLRPPPGSQVAGVFTVRR